MFQPVLQVLSHVYLMPPGTPVGMKYLLATAGLAAVQLVLQSPPLSAIQCETGTDVPYTRAAALITSPTAAETCRSDNRSPKKQKTDDT